MASATVIRREYGDESKSRICGQDAERCAMIVGIIGALLSAGTAAVYFIMGGFQFWLGIMDVIAVIMFITLIIAASTHNSFWYLPFLIFMVFKLAMMFGYAVYLIVMLILMPNYFLNDMRPYIMERSHRRLSEDDFRSDLRTWLAVFALPLLILALLMTWFTVIAQRAYENSKHRPARTTGYTASHA
uniref:Uncharacterized protein n=1 Tax=Ditylenchus dipsaci TaxID=166011 RepID=A0A915D459_9BILA